MITERGTRETPWGLVLHVQIGREDNARLSWLSIWKAFARAYPRRWAFEVFPPKESLVDEINAYHLWVLPEGRAPDDLRIDSR